MSSKSDPLINAKIGNRFVILKYLSKGAFGKVYIGKNIKTGEEVAIKMEKKNCPKSQLVLEFNFFRKLEATKSTVDSKEKRSSGIPKIHYFGPCGDEWHALVMDLLGPSLEEIHVNCGLKFSLKTTLLLSIQLMDVFEYFHSKQLIYRDVKPENFLMGRSGTDDYSTLHIIDFGLSKEYTEDNGEHIEFTTNKGMIGTVRYMSINGHNAFELSRRDDMEAIGYVIIYFLKGNLPWMGINDKDAIKRYKQIGKVKEKTTPDQLCCDIPKEFAKYLKAVRKLEFKEKPNYTEYRNLFNRLMEREGIENNGVYDFDRYHKPIKK